MELLLDTHTLIWWLSSSHVLDAGARTAIGNPRNSVFVSAASAWEIAIKAGLGKLQVPGVAASWLPAQLAKSRFRGLPIELHHALSVEALPRHHTDPFDRLLIAQAVAENLMIVTRDAQFARYGVPILTC
jgi:PIN domain nuclease of toxin-antitoxin system